MAMIGVYMLSACSGTEKFSPRSQQKVTARTPVTGWVWEPQYYVYNGRYRFVRGHYRKLISRKAYLKRSLRGNGPAQSYAAAR
ncbi:hypothetical protein KK083_27235 [Fulvivirgaceae bacterium PWU4]|uniref:Uncharacterized protein n=1 Tax=Chryseosolibacter histidini TaxID=2782349 RepID=A0AAP2GQY1_9BACT|nr:hypothetical protein [Chryseosolibacter histidini]MBT1700613.1 hypothetical protein [Chryseosolibacter histidini]